MRSKPLARALFTSLFAFGIVSHPCGAYASTESDAESTNKPEAKQKAEQVTQQGAPQKAKQPGTVLLCTPNPTNPLEHNNRGVELGSKGLWIDALREHKLAVKGDPDRWEFAVNLSAAHLEFGRYLVKIGRKSDAIVQFQEAIEADFKNRAAQEELEACFRPLPKDTNNSKIIPDSSTQTIMKR